MSTTISPNSDNGISSIVIVGITLASISTLIFFVLFIKHRINDYRRAFKHHTTTDMCCYVICGKEDTRIWVESPSFIRFKENVNKIVYSTYDNQINFTETDIIELTVINHSENCSVCLDTLSNKICKIPCGHMFHKHCLIDWIRYDNNLCPNCQTTIL